MSPPQLDALSPGTSSTWSDQRHSGQWLRKLPFLSGRTGVPQTAHVKESFPLPTKFLRPPGESERMRSPMAAIFPRSQERVDRV